MAGKGRKSNLIVHGEDVESDEDKGPPPSIWVTDTQGKEKGVRVVTYEGEAPESDIEDEFGSSGSLDSSNSLGIDQLDPEAAAVLGPILPQRRSPRLDPILIRKHREKNKGLRTCITDKFLSPVINQNVKKLEKLSQNLSNSQMQMQDALLQFRIGTGNLVKLQKELETFLEEDYLKDLNILPSDVERCPPAPPLDQDHPGNKQSSSSMSSILTAALSGGAHLI